MVVKNTLPYFLLSPAWIVMFLFCSISIKGQAVVDVLVKGEEGVKIVYFPPINAYSNYGIAADPQGKAGVKGNTRHIVLDSSLVGRGALVTVRVADSLDQFITLCDLLLFNGDTVQVSFDLSRKDGEELDVLGSNAKGHALYNKLDYYRSIKYEPLFEAFANKDNSIEQFKQVADSLADAYGGKFQKLHLEGKVCREFAELTHITFSMAFYRALSERLLRTHALMYRSTMAERLELLRKCNGIVDSMSKGYETTSLFGAPFYFSDRLVADCIRKGKIHASFQLDEPDTILPIEFQGFPKEFAVFALSEPSKLRDDLWGMLLLFFIENNPSVSQRQIDVFHKYVKSPFWRSALDIAFESNKSGPDRQLPNLKGEIVYLDSTGSAVNFAELAGRIEGSELILVDLWATWCGPCISSFRYLENLDSVFSRYKVARLFVSKDQLQQRKTWKKVIDKYNLAGYHVIAGDHMNAFIDKEIYGAQEEKGIPRYILLDKMGRVLEASIENLSSKEYMVSLFKSYLNGN